jgi:hypothetical protein
MPKVGITATAKPDKNTLAVLKMMRKNLVERQNLLKRFIAHTAAQTMLDDVRSAIPSGPAYNTYKSALKLVQFPTTEPVFAVTVEEARSEKTDSSRDILYFRERNTGRRLPPEVKILLQYQPWTADTLPFKPPEKNVEMRKRRVSEREVELVRQEIQKKRREWTGALNKAGVRIEPVVGAEAVPDLTYTALRLEYGLGGSRAVAHWRPALVSVQQRVAQLFLDDSTGKALFDPEYTGWMKWRTLSEEFVPATVIESFGQFQDKIR